MMPARALSQTPGRVTPPEGPIPIVRIPLGALRLPTTAFAVIENNARWRLLWSRYQTRESIAKGVRPPVMDFALRRILVVNVRAVACDRDSLVTQVHGRYDSIFVVATAVAGYRRGCANSFAAAEAISLLRDDRPIRVVVNAFYQQKLQPAPWFSSRTLADVDTIPDPRDRAGWIEVLARLDTTPENLRTVVPTAIRSDASSPVRLQGVTGHEAKNVLLALPWVQRDSSQVFSLMVSGATWTDEATRLLIESDGARLVSASQTDAPTLALIARYLLKMGQHSPLLERIYTHPVIASDTTLRLEIGRSGLMTPRKP
jgi:hypothetical protein